MGIGIVICGLNGSGKSTLGRALAERLGFRFLDNEELYFSKSDPDYLFSNPRSREEAEKIFACRTAGQESFVFAAVKGDYGEKAEELYQYAVLIEAPRDIRLRRVRARSYQKFGDRMLQGGDLYEREEDFFEMVRCREEDYAEKWWNTLSCPVIRVDGTKEVEENLNRIIEWMARPMYKGNSSWQCCFPDEKFFK